MLETELTSGDDRTPQGALAAPANTTTPFLDNLDDERSNVGVEIFGAEPQISAGHVPRPVFSGRLLSLKNNKKKRMAGSGTTGNWGARMFDYDQKYEVDEWGAEMGPESRFCKMYVDETEIYDLKRVDSWRDVLDVLLVFIGLFSAIVTAFVIQTSAALQPDYGRLTATLVYNLIVVQRALANGTLDSVPLPEDPADPHVSPSSVEKWVNGLWFTSLAISLSTALVTVLTKQWLYHYMSQTSGTSRDRARLRQFRFAGLEKYHVPMIIDLLPVALHIALALFLVGLALFLSALDRRMAAAVIVISGIAYISYIVSAFLPLYDTQCPYQSPISSYLHRLKVFIIRGTRTTESVIAYTSYFATAFLPSYHPQSPISRYLHLLKVFTIRQTRRATIVITQAKISCLSVWTSVRGSVPQLRQRLESSIEPDRIEKHEEHMKAIRTRPSPAVTLAAQERHTVLERCHQLDIDAITWLSSTSSNSTVRKISFLASVGLTPSAADTRRLCDVIRPYCSDMPSLRIEGLDHSQIEHIAVCIDGFNDSISSPNRLEYVPIDEGDGYHVFTSLIVPILSQNDPWFSAEGKQLVMADFLAPGQRAHLRFPLSVWRLCINELAMPALDPVMVAHMLQETHAQRGNTGCDSPATFSDALTSNPYLQSLMLDLLAKKLGVKRDTVSSLTSKPLLDAIMMWSVSHLGNSELRFIWGEKSYETALSLVHECLKHPVLRGRPMDSIIPLRDSCAHSLSRALSFESTAKWKVYVILGDLLSSLWRYHPGLPCPPALLSALLSYCTATTYPRLTGPPFESVLEYRALSVIPWMIARSDGDARASHYNMLHEYDITLARSGGDESYISQFWTLDMCRVAVFSLKHAIDITAEWAQNWISYIDVPERLSFIFKRLLREPDYSTDNLSLTKRASYLLDFAARSMNWGAIFPSLIAVLEDDAFITSIKDCENTRHQLSSILLHMQKTLTSVDLSMYAIPIFDEDDKEESQASALNATDSHENVALLALDSQSNSPDVPPAPDQLDPSEQTDSVTEPSPALEPSQPVRSTSDLGTVVRIWDKTKAIVRLTKPVVSSEQTLKELEEAGA